MAKPAGYEQLSSEEDRYQELAEDPNANEQGEGSKGNKVVIIRPPALLLRYMCTFVQQTAVGNSI